MDSDCHGPFCREEWLAYALSHIAKKGQMELFNLHIQQGRDLCSKLAVSASVIKTPAQQLQSQLAIEVVSPILANSQNPLSVAREG